MSRKAFAPAPTLPTWAPSSSLRAFYVAEFRPDLLKRRKPKKTIQLYDSALYRFERFTGGEPRLGDVTNELLVKFAYDSVSRRTGQSYSQNLAKCIRALVRHWNANALPRHVVLPPAEPGTCRWYFEEVYRKEVQFAVKPDSVENTRNAMRKLYAHFGRDLMLTELTDALAAEFFGALLESGAKAATINTKFRATWFSVWNHAYDRGLVSRPPRTKKLKEIRPVPDSWSLNELQGILAAAQQFRPNEFYGAVRANLWWDAILRIGYWTALRKSALLAIRHEHLDLRAGTLYVPGEHEKNRASKIYRLGRDAVDAAGKIWVPPRPEFFPLPGRCSQDRQLDTHFKQILAAAEVAPSRRSLGLFHKLRRTSATLLAARHGVTAASRLLGHSDTYVTAKYINPDAMPQNDATSLLPSLAAG